MIEGSLFGFGSYNNKTFLKLQVDDPNLIWNVKLTDLPVQDGSVPPSNVKMH